MEGHRRVRYNSTGWSTLLVVQLVDGAVRTEGFPATLDQTRVSPWRLTRFGVHHGGSLGRGYLFFRGPQWSPPGYLGHRRVGPPVVAVTAQEVRRWRRHHRRWRPHPRWWYSPHPRWRFLPVRPRRRRPRRGSLPEETSRYNRKVDPQIHFPKTRPRYGPLHLAARGVRDRFNYQELLHQTNPTYTTGWGVPPRGRRRRPRGEIRLHPDGVQPPTGPIRMTGLPQLIKVWLAEKRYYAYQRQQVGPFVELLGVWLQRRVHHRRGMTHRPRRWRWPRRRRRFGGRYIRSWYPYPHYRWIRRLHYNRWVELRRGASAFGLPGVAQLYRYNWSKNRFHFRDRPRSLHRGRSHRLYTPRGRAVFPIQYLRDTRRPGTDLTVRSLLRGWFGWVDKATRYAPPRKIKKDHPVVKAYKERFEPPQEKEKKMPPRRKVLAGYFHRRWSAERGGPGDPTARNALLWKPFDPPRRVSTFVGETSRLFQLFLRRGQKHRLENLVREFRRQHKDWDPVVFYGGLYLPVLAGGIPRHRSVNYRPSHLYGALVRARKWVSRTTRGGHRGWWPRVVTELTHPVGLHRQRDKFVQEVQEGYATF